MSKPATYRLELTPLPGFPNTPESRLAILLKAALRQYGFRCLQAVELPADPPAASAPPNGATGTPGALPDIVAAPTQETTHRPATTTPTGG